jgi:hypothetical protein
MNLNEREIASSEIGNWRVTVLFVNNTGEEIEMPTREIVRLRF